jgi:integrase
MASPKLQAYLLLKEATGLAKQDLLLIELSDIKEDGLHARRRKTKSKPKIYAWDTDGILHSGIDLARSAHRSHIGSRHLFHTRQGKPYYFVDEQGHATGKPEAFDSMWQRLMSKWVTAGNERFTEHDIRAKAASDTKSEHAQELMDHSTKEMTEKVYRRKPKVVHINKGE